MTSQIIHDLNQNSSALPNKKAFYHHCNNAVDRAPVCRLKVILSHGFKSKYWRSSFFCSYSLLDCNNIFYAYIVVVYGFKFIHFYWVIDLNLFAIWGWRHLLCFCLSLDWLGACLEIPGYIQLGKPMWMVLSSCFIAF